MGATTGIQWCHHTYNPWEGCAKVSPGCANCYAEARANRWKTAKWGPHAARRISRSLDAPIRWDRDAEKAGERRRVFSLSLGDWLEDRDELVESRERLAAMILACPHLDWLLLTKRPENWGLASEAFGWDVVERGFPPNVWPGVSAENQECVDLRVAKLLEVRASVHWVSYEPALEPVDWDGWLGPQWTADADPDGPGYNGPGLSWVVVGGESGPKRRQMNMLCVTRTVRQCREADVACFVKQDSGLYDGRQGRIPDELWAVKEFPRVA